MNRDGFTLLELAIVLFVLAIVSASVLAKLAQDTRLRKERELAIRLKAIESALIGVGLSERRLPCPADGAVPISAAAFGRETGPAAACTSGSAEGTFGDGVNSVGGVLPVKALGTCPTNSCLTHGADGSPMWWTSG